MAGLTLSLLGPRSGARNAGFTTRWRRLDLHLLEWSQGGSWCLDLPERTVRARPGQVLLVAAGQRHRLRVPPGVRLHSTWLMLHGEAGPGQPIFAGWSFPPLLSVAASTRIQRLARSLDGQSGLALRCARIAAAGTLGGILAAHGAPPPSTPGAAMQRLAPVLAEIDARIAAPYPLTRLAHRLGIAHARLHDLFHEAVGCAPGEYILRRRILAAQRLLSESAAPLAAIAAACGIASAPYLCRLFRQRSGMTPGEWRSRPDSGRMADG